MKNYFNCVLKLLGGIVAFLVASSCTEKTTLKDKETVQQINLTKPSNKNNQISDEFKKYWYSGEAEISSYHLKQARYGEIREGKAVLIFVSEPFHKQKQVKTSGDNPYSIPILKLNSTKEYFTGIYPYSIMTSCFYPVYDNQHALKVSFSAQEWCGQVYAQLNNQNSFEIKSHSYFESEADEQISLKKTFLENELWNKIRINPKLLPTGTFDLIPAMEYIRLSHKEFKAFKVKATLKKSNDMYTYEVNYQELERILKINFTSTFPYSIESWSEHFRSGFGTKAKMMTSSATKIKTLKTPYWQKNSNQYLPLRDTLGL